MDVFFTLECDALSMKFIWTWISIHLIILVKIKTIYIYLIKSAILKHNSKSNGYLYIKSYINEIDEKSIRVKLIKRGIKQRTNQLNKI